MSGDRLALHGGMPVWNGGWPSWPVADERTAEAVTAALGSGRWTVSGGWTGVEPYEQVFARRFAEFCGAGYGVATDHGSSALLVALLAVGVGAGDEVIVPALTWVATASAVLAAGAVPVFADVEPGTGCIDPVAVEAAVTARTRAILPVHLHCRMADVDELGGIATRHGVALIEDAAQAHGAVWGGRRAGTFGAVGAFSMQQGKVLTAGEGGAAVTDDPDLYDRLQQLRADSRRYRSIPPALGHPYLEEVGEVMGANFCLSELPAALLLDQLERLEQQLETRAAAADRLDRRLAALPGLAPMERSARLERPSVFAYAVRRDPGAFGGVPTAQVCAAVEAELGIRVSQPDRSVPQSALYHPETVPRFAAVAERAGRGGRFPVAEHLADTVLLLPHRALLAGEEALDAVVAAFEKVLAADLTR